MDYSLSFVATGELPGVAHRLVLVQAVAIGVVVNVMLSCFSSSQESRNYQYNKSNHSYK